MSHQSRDWRPLALLSGIIICFFVIASDSFTTSDNEQLGSITTPSPRSSKKNDTVGPESKKEVSGNPVENHYEDNSKDSLDQRYIFRGLVMDRFDSPLQPRIEIGVQEFWGNSDGEFLFEITRKKTELVKFSFIHAGFKTKVVTLSLNLVKKRHDFGTIVLKGEVDHELNIVDRQGNPVIGQEVAWRTIHAAKPGLRFTLETSGFEKAGKTSVAGKVSLPSMPPSGSIVIAVGSFDGFPRIVQTELNSTEARATVVIGRTADVTIDWGEIPSGLNISLSASFRLNHEVQITHTIRAVAGRSRVAFQPGMFEILFKLPGSEPELERVAIDDGSVLSPSFKSLRHLKVFVEDDSGHPVRKFSAAAHAFWGNSSIPHSTIISGLNATISAVGTNGEAQLAIPNPPGKIPFEQLIIAIEASAYNRQILILNWPARQEHNAIRVKLVPSVRIIANCTNIPIGALLRLRQLRYSDDTTAEPECPIACELRYDGSPRITLRPKSIGLHQITVQVTNSEVSVANFQVQETGEQTINLLYNSNTLVVAVNDLPPREFAKIAIVPLRPANRFIPYEHFNKEPISGTSSSTRIKFEGLEPGRYLVAPIKDLRRMTTPYPEQLIANVSNGKNTFTLPEKAIGKAVINFQWDPSSLGEAEFQLVWAIVPKGQRVFRQGVIWSNLPPLALPLELRSAFTGPCRLIVGAHIDGDESQSSYGPLIVGKWEAPDVNGLDGRTILIPPFSIINLEGRFFAPSLDVKLAASLEREIFVDFTRTYRLVTPIIYSPAGEHTLEVKDERGHWEKQAITTHQSEALMITSR